MDPSLRAFPLIQPYANGDNPIYESIFDTFQSNPIYIRDGHGSSQIVEFLRISRAPSAIANISPDHLSGVAQRIDDAYVLAMEEYVSLLNRAIDADLEAYEQYQPTKTQHVITEIIKFTHTDAGFFSILFWTFIGTVVGLYEREGTTRELKLSSSCEHRKRWLEEVRIYEKIRFMNARTELNVRINTINEELAALGEDITDLGLEQEKQQLESILATFQTLDHVIFEE